MTAFSPEQLLWAVALFALTLAAFGLPVTPAIRELLSKGDADPLVVDPHHDDTARYAVGYALLRDGSSWKDEAMTIGHEQDVAHAVTTGPVVVGPRARVRDAVAGDVVHLRTGTRIDGVAMATDALHVEPDCAFAWIDAPTVRFGSGRGDGGFDPIPETERQHPARRNYQVLPARFRRHTGDWAIAPGESVHGDYVVTGDLRLGSEAVVAGHFKVYGSVTIGAGASLWGNVFAEGDIALESRAFVAGVVSAGRRVTLGPAVAVGLPGRLSSVAGAEVLAWSGATVHGSVRAHRKGRSLAVSADDRLAA